MDNVENNQFRYEYPYHTKQSPFLGSVLYYNGDGDRT